MTDLLLTHGYFLSEDEKEQEIMRPYPPLGILYLSAELKRRGLEVEVFDATLRARSELETRLAGAASVIGIYTTMMTRGSAVRIVEQARRHGWSIVVGGPDASTYPEEYLRHGAHAVVIGEGERALEELVAAFGARGHHRLHPLDGIVFLDEAGEVVRTKPRAMIEDLDALPWPDREAIDVQSYVDIWREHHGEGSVNLITARGCPYKCNWCSHAVYGFSHRRRSAADCADEAAWIVDRYQPDQLWYADDVFTIHSKWLLQYRDALRERGVDVPFETISRADRLVQPDVLDALADLNCNRIWIGTESGSQRILDAMQRGVTKEQAQLATKELQKRGIEVGMFLMWGYEGEEFVDVEETVDFVSTVQPDVFFTTLAYPIFGTGYYDKVADRVIVPKPWAETSDREHEVAGRPGREHFRPADEWLRASVAAQAARGAGVPGEATPDASEAAAHAERAAEARARFLAACRERGLAS